MGGGGGVGREKYGNTERNPGQTTKVGRGADN